MFLPLSVRGKGQLDHLADLKRLTLLAISIRGLHITHTIGLLQSKAISLICSISINWFMLSNLTLLRLAYSHYHHLQKLLVPNHLGHVHRGLRDSTLHWTWVWLELLRSSEMLAWLFLCHHTLCHIPFLLIFIDMSTVYFIRLKDMLLIIVRHFAMPYRIWLILLVNLSGPSVIVNPLPTHSMHTIPSPPSLQ